MRYRIMLENQPFEMNEFIQERRCELFNISKKRKKIGELSWSDKYDVFILECTFMKKKVKKIYTMKQYEDSNCNVGTMLVNYYQEAEAFKDYTSRNMTTSSLCRRLKRIIMDEGDLPIYILVGEDTEIPIEEIYFDPTKIVLR